MYCKLIKVLQVQLQISGSVFYGRSSTACTGLNAGYPGIGRLFAKDTKEHLSHEPDHPSQIVRKLVLRVD